MRYLQTWKYWYDFAVRNNGQTEANASKFIIDFTLNKYTDFSVVSIQPIAQFDRDRNAIATQILSLKNLFPDSDDDGLGDAEEISLGTDPLLADSDADGISDYDEINYDAIAFFYLPGADLNPLLADTDGDGFNVGIEIA